MSTRLPPGARLVTDQAEVTPEMGAWSLDLLHDVAGHPMDAVDVQAFGGRRYLARVEIHTNGTKENPAPHPHRGITLYALEGLADPATPAAHVELPEHARGIDVSDYQRNPPVDWPKVAGAGVTFAFIKASEGVSNTAKSFSDNWLRARAAFILRGAYHFFRTTSDPAEQVRHFVDVVRAAGGAAPDLPFALDVEWQRAGDPLGGISAADFADRVARAVDELAALTGRRPLLYTTPGFWALLPPRPAIARAADLWLAHYGVPKPAPAGAWGSAWTFWQHTPQAAVPGVPGPADANVFRGSVAELQAYAAGVGSPGGAEPPPIDGPDLGTTAGVQAALNALGAAPPLKVDGVLGPKTAVALVSIQLRLGVSPADGHIGAATVRALRDALRARKG